jgi:hypothetical protein
MVCDTIHWSCRVGVLNLGPPFGGFPIPDFRAIYFIKSRDGRRCYTTRCFTDGLVRIRSTAFFYSTRREPGSAIETFDATGRFHAGGKSREQHALRRRGDSTLLRQGTTWIRSCAFRVSRPRELAVFEAAPSSGMSLCVFTVPDATVVDPYEGPSPRSR